MEFRYRGVSMVVWTSSRLQFVFKKFKKFEKFMILSMSKEDQNRNESSQLYIQARRLMSFNLDALVSRFNYFYCWIITTFLGKTLTSSKMRLIPLHMTCTHQTKSFISSLWHLRSTWTNKQLHNSNFKLVEEEEKNKKQNRQNVIKTIVKLSRTKEEDKEVSSQKSEEFLLERKSIGLKDFKHFIFLLLSQHVYKFKGDKLFFCLYNLQNTMKYLLDMQLSRFISKSCESFFELWK